MPCVILLLTTQHSRLIELSEDLARTAAAGRDAWPGDLYEFRRSLVRHDRMERDVFNRLGVPVPDSQLSVEFDTVLASQVGLDAGAVAAAAEAFVRVIEDHAFIQETRLFPALTERHPISIRRQLGERYALHAPRDAAAVA
jgi:hypothetical protein